MAKVSKSVREKRKDFSRTKLKVGKSKRLPDNHTETSFRSKAVVLPKQSVTQDASIKEAQSLQHYTALLSHKNGDTRKDALQQMSKYLMSHPPRLSTTITPLTKALFPLIIDDTTTVRTMLLELFNAILSNVPKPALDSHLEILLLYISSAMTHISPSIRANSTKFLDWAFRCTSAKELIASTQLDKFINTFSTLFGWSGQAATIGSSRVLAFHLSCFQNLLDFALADSPEIIEEAVQYQVPMGYENPCFVPHRSTKALLHPCSALHLFTTDVRENVDSTNFDIIEPNVKVMVKFISDRFTDSSNGDRTLCLPILRIMRTLVSCSQAKDREDTRTALKLIARGMINIQEIAGPSTVQGLIGEWTAIQDELE